MMSDNLINSCYPVVEYCSQEISTHLEDFSCAASMGAKTFAARRAFPLPMHKVEAMPEDAKAIC
jgi:hypothetical protein